MGNYNILDLLRAEIFISDIRLENAISQDTYELIKNEINIKKRLLNQKAIEDERKDDKTTS